SAVSCRAHALLITAKWCHDRTCDRPTLTQACVAGDGGVGSLEDNDPRFGGIGFVRASRWRLLAAKRLRSQGKGAWAMEREQEGETLVATTKAGSGVVAYRKTNGTVLPIKVCKE